MENNINKNWKKFLNEEMTKAQELGITEFPYVIKDGNENVIYWEGSNRFWIKSEFDENNNRIYSKDSNEYWEKREFDENNNKTYFENSSGYWEKLEYDQNNNEVKSGYSNGRI